MPKAPEGAFSCQEKGVEGLTTYRLPKQRRGTSSRSQQQFCCWTPQKPYFVLRLKRVNVNCWGHTHDSLSFFWCGCLVREVGWAQGC